MNHDIDWRGALRLEAVVPPYTTWPPMPGPARLSVLSLDDHFPWHRIRRMSRK